MKTLLRYRLFSLTASVMLVAALAYACKDYLVVPSQGTLDETTLATKAGVEGTLIAAYRALDCTSALQPNWGCAASNWVCLRPLPWSLVSTRPVSLERGRPDSPY